MTAKEYYKNLKVGDKLFHFQYQIWGTVLNILEESGIFWEGEELKYYQTMYGSTPILLYQEARILDLDNLPPKPKRWRANYKDKFWYILYYTNEVMVAYDNKSIYSDSLYEFGNYFQTKEQAEMARDQIKELLIKFHENNK